MTRETDLEPLLKISRAAYDQQRKAFDRIVLEETRLRSELSRLRDMQATARETPNPPMQIIGADLHWQGWLARSRTELNIELARVLALKAHEQQRVRKAFGKVAALEELASQAQKTRRKKQADQRLSQTIDMALHRGPQ